MMTCREFSDFLEAYVGGDLDDATREVFEGHLEACPPCIDYLDSYRETIRLCRKAYERETAVVPPPEDLVRAILDAKGRGRG